MKRVTMTAGVDTEASKPSTEKKRMSAIAIVINYFFNLLLMGITAYILSRVIIDFKVTLFTMHIILVTPGVIYKLI
jgi:hypothetical protein